MTRHVEFQRLHNFRDLGGYATANGGATKWGVLFRSDNLRKLSESADVERFRALDVRTVIDLRYPWEIEQSGRVPEFPGLRYVNLSIEHQPYDQGALGDDFDPWRFLADRGCPFGQGYFFSRPVPPDQITSMVRRRGLRLVETEQAS